MNEKHEINKTINQRLMLQGRITLPLAIREHYNLQRGDLIELTLHTFQKNNNDNGGNSQCLQQ